MTRPIVFGMHNPVRFSSGSAQSPFGRYVAEVEKYVEAEAIKADPQAWGRTVTYDAGLLSAVESRSGIDPVAAGEFRHKFLAQVRTLKTRSKEALTAADFPDMKF